MAPVFVPVNLVTPEEARTLFWVETNSVFDEEDEDDEPDWLEPESEDDDEPPHQHLLSLR
jgi:hypothetical protein